MAVNDFNQSSAPEEESEEQEFDAQALKDLVGFALRAPRRRPRLAATIVVVGVLATVATAILTPRVYESEVRILAQRNLLVPALGNPNRPLQHESDTRNVSDTIMRRENLIALVKEVNLLDRWDTTRPPILRFKDKVMTSIVGKQTEEEKIRGLVGYLEKQLQVGADDTSVTITVDWPDPRMSYELAAAVERNFVEAHYDSDVAMINDALGILEEHAKEENDNIGVALTELVQAIADQNHPKPAPPEPASSAAPGGNGGVVAAVPRRAAPPKPAALDPAVKMLDDKRGEIKELQAQKDKSVADLKQQLQNAEITLAPAHPMVIALKERLADAKKDSPELAALRSDERALVAQLAGPASAAPAGSGTTGTAPDGTTPAPTPRPSYLAPAPTAAPIRDVTPNQAMAQAILDEPPQISLARSKLQHAMLKYTDLESRIDGAKIELDVTRAAFKYRFSIVTPPEVPKKPRKPNVVVLVLGGVFASLLFALGAAAAKDYLEGRFIEAWQVRRRLNIPLLGEVDYPS